MSRYTRLVSAKFHPVILMTQRPGEAADDRVGLELLQSIWALHGVQ